MNNTQELRYLLSSIQKTKTYQDTNHNLLAINIAETKKNTLSYHQMSINNSDVAQIYLEQGLAYWSEQKWQDTIEACEKALDFNPNLTEAYKTVGNALQKIGKISDAIGYYARALEIEPDFAEIYANLGTLYAQQQQWQQAIKYYQQAIEIKPDFAAVYVQLAKIWKKIRSSRKCRTNVV